MYTEIVADASFLQVLLQIDRRLLEVAKKCGCAHCSSTLHISHYPRKIRGLSVDADPVFAVRFSLCCGHCRRRHTPPSVRFMGRRVYAFVAVIVACVQACIAAASVRSVRRWRRWWTERLPCLAVWKHVQSRFVPGIDVEQLPKALLDRCEPVAGQCSSQGMLRMLALMLPLSRSEGQSTIADGGLPREMLAQSMLIFGEYQDLLSIRSASELNS